MRRFWLFCCYLFIAYISPVYAEVTPVVWQGIALGSGAEMRLYTEDKALAERVIEQAQQEIEHLESIFSLYREDSTLSQLNKAGRLASPPPELLAVLVQVKDIHAITQGKFDPTIQVLWNLYAAQVKQADGLRQAPSSESIKQALRLVDFKAVHFNEKEVAFRKKGMSMSLNGIAQGYITDKVMEIIRQAGIRRALIDIGEIRAMDLDKVGQWQVGIRNPKVQEGIFFKVPLQNGAISTSGGYGTVFDAEGHFTHIFNPKSGDNRERYQSVSVQAPTAALADALSTAFSVSSVQEIKQVVQQLPQIKVWVVDSHGKVVFKEG